MGKRSLVLAFVSILCMSFLVNGILFMEWSKEKKQTTDLNAQVAEVTADNEQLRKTVAELEGTIAYPEQKEEAVNADWQHSIWWRAAMLRGDSEKEAAFNQRINENPIDAYFHGLKEPVTTVDFNAYYYLYENAWKDEMDAVYQKLLVLLKDPALQKQFIEAQTNFAAGIQGDYDIAVAAFGAEGSYPMYGTNVWLLNAGLAQGYKERTIALLEWTYFLDDRIDFTFNATEFQKKYDPSDLREQNSNADRQNSVTDGNVGVQSQQSQQSQPGQQSQQGQNGENR